jgi:preprotein translocase subunit SecD
MIVATLAALFIVWPTNPDRYLPSFVPWPSGQGIAVTIGNFTFERRAMRLGLDLQGGTHIVLQADLSQVPAAQQASQLEGVRRVIERRINAYGVSEALVERLGNDRISVQLPGVRNIEEARSLIGKTAQLDFREARQTPDGTFEFVPATAVGSDGTLKQLTGAYLKPTSQVIFNAQSGLPEVSFEWESEGAQLFEGITQRNIGRPLGIFLDDQLVSAPTVQAVIRDRGVITGVALEDARILAIQLNAGALPVPVSVVQQQDVDATLVSDSVQKSILAGEVGLGVVILFMILYYRLPGVLAGIALTMYTVLLLAIFKLVPVTLTLSGIAASILSIGMAVDANILIFERLKEELRNGRTLRAAIEAGFGRAWSSIRDSNISTLITCAVLYWFGSNFGAPLVQGFALTLAIGVLLSMFTAIVVSRSLLRFLVGRRLAQNTALFVP